MAKPKKAVAAVANNEKTTEKQAGGVTGKGFMPGVSGNPSGRPRGSTILSDAYRRKLAEINPDDPEGRTYADCIAAGMVKEALIGAKNVQAAGELSDRVEGKAKQSIELNSKSEFDGWTVEQKLEYARTGRKPGETVQ
jgi:hypothetical protein